MMKFGIYRLEQLKSGRLRSILRGKKKISVSILYDNDVSELDDNSYESIMFEQVDDRGAFKRTNANRFSDFDARIVQHILSRNPASFRIHDVGVSNARTSVDLFLNLEKYIPSFRYHASDYGPYLTLLRKGNLTIALSGNTNIVDITFPPFVFTPYQLESRLFYPVNHIVRRLLLRGPVKRLLEYHERRINNACIEGQINLFCPPARALAERTDRFSLGQHDVLEPYGSDTPLDCVRAMNVLNDTYFSASQMQQILGHIFDSLKLDGLFIVGSNQDADSTVDGGAYRKSAEGFQRELSSGDPAAIHQHILLFNQSTGRSRRNSSA